MTQSQLEATDHDAVGPPLTALVSIRAIDPSQPDHCPQRLPSIPVIESGWSVAGDESDVRQVRITTPLENRPVTTAPCTGAR